MSTFRSPAALEAEIADTARRLKQLAAERDRLREERRTGIVADFDAGLAPAAIAARREVSYGYVASVLHKAGRSQRARRRDGLTPAQRPHYDKLLDMGVRSRLAQSIARAVAP
jgi:hypothetical protein